MRLHRLRLNAFGPFAQDTVIDFDALGEDGLFLLHGQTGSGKTTVLDAVAFALFGRVPGARHEGRRLHSDHAPAQQLPEVELEATIGGRRLRLLRSPEYERPKKRGEGTTRVHARASLSWLDDSGPALTRLPEIGEVMTRLLGMSADQFFQVVLLPQGEFSRFLRANSEDREQLLQRLFDTERFGGVEDWLKERARVGAAAVTEKVAAVSRIAGQVAGAAGVEMPEQPQIEWAQGCLDHATTTAGVASDALARARSDLNDAHAAFAAGQQQQESRRRGEQAAARLAELERGDADLAVVRELLSAARSAAPVLPVADDAVAAERAATRAQRASGAAHADFIALPEGAAVGDTDADLEAAIQQWTVESARWEPLAERAAARPRLAADSDHLEREIASAHTRLTQLSQNLDAAPSRRDAASVALATAVDGRRMVERLTAEHSRVAAVAEALTDREVLNTELAQARSLVDDAVRAHLDAREHHLNLRERRIAGMAAELAESLVEGQACVVCGALEHPTPAGRDPDHRRVGAEAENAASRAEDAAARRRSEAEAVVTTLTERLSHLTSIIGDTSAEHIRAHLERVERELDAAHHRVREIPVLEQRLAAIDAEIAQWRQTQADVSAAQSGRHERLVAVHEQIAAIDAEIHEATGGRLSIVERRAELAQLCSRGAVVQQARQEAVHAGRLRDDLAARLQTRCNDAGFADATALRAAAATPDQMREWEIVITRAATVRASAEATLAEDAVAEALAGEPVDIEVLERRYQKARDDHDSLARDCAIETQRATSLQTYVADFWAADSVLGPARTRQERVQNLADLVAGRGQNARRMSLHSYVLAARLEEVLVAASVRLRQMSSGRYEFVHSDSAGPRGRRGGLGIEVRDEYTGAVRPAATLSGGETFYASLALALGLADVVSAESGGRIMDTIFIDEGFGTLDPEALDEVMGVLDELREGGRVVGVVSHVDELRARIPAQLHVLRGENGSRVQLQRSLGVC